MTMTAVQIKTEPGVTPGNPYQICRLCMSKESLDDLFKEKDLHQWITDFLSIKITTEDRISKAICAMCRQRLIEFHHFRLRSQEVQTVLQSMVQVENDEVETEIRGPKRAQDTTEHKCTRCGKSFLKRPHLDKHMKNHDSQNKTVECSNRDKEQSIGIEDMIDIDEVKIETQTDDAALPPDDSFSSSSEIDENAADSDQPLPEKEDTRGTDDSFQCNICHKMLQSGRALWGHYRVVHGPKNHTCHICDIGFPFLKDLKKHEVTNKHVNKVKELQENKKPKDKLPETKENPTNKDETLENCSNLKQHTVDNNDNGNSKFKPKCTLKRKRQLEAKDTKEKDQSIYVQKKDCSPEVLVDADYTPDHSTSDRLLQGLDNGDQLHCDICNEVFPNEKKLMFHKKYHDSKRHKCSKCGKTFLNRFVLQEHKSSHEVNPKRKRTKFSTRSTNPAKPYKCTICEKLFKLQSSLRNHSYEFHEARTHVCDICGSKFATGFDLGWHKKIHDGQSDQQQHEQTEEKTDNSNDGFEWVDADRQV